MYRATFISSNFTFEAFGETKQVAIASLELGLHRHAKQYDIDPDWWKEFSGDLYTTEIHCGSCYRDNEKIPQC
jgi:hypothetical protein